MSTPGTPSAMFGGAFAGRRVLVTGHTGFKGSWLCEWLLQLGADVVGLGLPPNTQPALFDQLRLADRIHSVFADVRNADSVMRLAAESRPDYVFHLAAQPLVRRSYREPVLTWQCNVMGTLHVLEALRTFKHPCAAVLVTTDKCYENREWLYGYREEDSLGGFDPYSSSKAAAEIAITAWRRSFFRITPSDSPAPELEMSSAAVTGPRTESSRTAPARGLPIGQFGFEIQMPPAPGSMSSNRFQATWRWRQRSPIRLPPPNCSAPSISVHPRMETARSASSLRKPSNTSPGAWQDTSDPSAPHEAGLLQLATDKAAALIHWRPAWSFKEAVRETVKWYFDVSHSADPDAACHRLRDQIQTYTASAHPIRIPWATTTGATSR